MGNTSSSASINSIATKKVKVGDIYIAYKIFGKGKPLLLIAGSGASMDMWDPTVLKQLSANHTVIIFDCCP
jgi:pimeloyl-ACP methyl ester carboxylesterase